MLMLNFRGEQSRSDCERTGRRDFLKIGTLGLTGLGLSDLLRQRAAATASGREVKDTSVIWLWLAGGASHIETFDPKMNAPAEFRSMVGAAPSSVPGVHLGGLFPQMARRAHRLSLVRSFAHGNSGHLGGTHHVMTGWDNPLAVPDSGAAPNRPSMGSIAARVRGPNHAATGMPTYVRLRELYAEGPHWLGPACAPFNAAGQARNNLNVPLALDRIGDRRALLRRLDVVSREIDQSGLMSGLDRFEQQAFDLILGRAKDAFDLEREDPRLRDRYGLGGLGSQAGLGDHLLLARRLCEAGCSFVTFDYANSSQGWDMHSNMLPQLHQACPPMDRAVSAFLDDLEQRGLSDKILLVITGEFGRTPRINGDAGRDHWGPLCTLALAGGGLNMGRVVGESTARAEGPRSQPIYPKDLMATIFHVLGIDPQQQFVDQSGRPQYLLDEGARPIAELI
jgi:hypothetical protein